MATKMTNWLKMYLNGNKNTQKRQKYQMTTKYTKFFIPRPSKIHLATLIPGEYLNEFFPPSFQGRNMNAQSSFLAQSLKMSYIGDDADASSNQGSILLTNLNFATKKLSGHIFSHKLWNDFYQKTTYTFFSDNVLRGFQNITYKASKGHNFKPNNVFVRKLRPKPIRKIDPRAPPKTCCRPSTTGTSPRTRPTCKPPPGSSGPTRLSAGQRRLWTTRKLAG
jgi:hypothetical protein